MRLTHRGWASEANACCSYLCDSEEPHAMSQKNIKF